MRRHDLFPFAPVAPNLMEPDHNKNLQQNDDDKIATKNKIAVQQHDLGCLLPLDICISNYVKPVSTQTQDLP
jgi:hypothetical protein